MSVWIDQKYLSLISHNLRNYKTKKSDLFNFSCPFCGDSKKNLTKARGFVFRKQNDYFYMCHNCGTSTTFSNLLKHVNERLHKEYILERYMSNQPTQPVPEVKPVEQKVIHLKMFHEVFTEAGDLLESIQNLPKDHYARLYIESRKIPEKFYGEIFYTPDFKTFMDKVFPNHDKDLKDDDPRIILFYTNILGAITNVAGRSLQMDDYKLRYISVKVTELDEKKVFGMHRFRSNRRAYIVEGQFDSFFLPNCVASGDSNLTGLADWLDAEDKVLVYDNEPRNKEIVRLINGAIKEGYKVFISPFHESEGKDLNEYVKYHNLSPDELLAIVEDNTFQGLSAELHFSEWRRL